MAKYIVKAYPDWEYGLTAQEKVITASNEEQAWIQAWKTFPEYHEIGVWEQEESDT